MMGIVGLLMLHLVYGATVGAMYRPKEPPDFRNGQAVRSGEARHSDIDVMRRAA